MLTLLALAVGAFALVPDSPDHDGGGEPARPTQCAVVDSLLGFLLINGCCAS